MKTLTSSKASSRPITSLVRQRIARSGERLWRLEDFRDLPFAAVAQVLSRLTRRGTLERLSKGVYYRTRETAFGKSRPNPAAKPFFHQALPLRISWDSPRRAQGTTRLPPAP